MSSNPSKTRPAGPLVSVVIPTYKRTQQTIDAIDSVFAQTAADLEVIVVDDGSPDGSGDTLESLFRQRTEDAGRLSFYRQANQGASAARNTGAAHARGEYLAFLDSDDLWYPEKLERQLAAFAQLSPACGACFTDARLTNKNGLDASSFHDHGRVYKDPFGIDPTAAVSLARSFSGFWISSLLVRTELFLQIGGFTRDISFAEDRDLHFRLALNTAIGYVNQQLVEIDRTPTPKGTNQRPWDSHELQFRQQERMLECWLTTATLPPRIRRTVEQALGDLLSSQTNWHLEHRRYPEAREAAKRAVRYRARPGTVFKFALIWLLPPLARSVAPRTRPIGTGGHAS
jgi:cellulose synthase/poly-beta-1,6-N-acetylglucosamine synthase-like glycosyltransferase